MDTAYLKNTVGPVLSKAISSYIAHGGVIPSEDPEFATQHAVEYVGTYLLHHDATQNALAAEEAATKSVRKLKYSLWAAREEARRLEAEERERAQKAKEEEELRLRLAQEAELAAQKKAEEEAAAAAAAADAAEAVDSGEGAADEEATPAAESREPAAASE